jgi:tetratricopeptide (TPR) repeat protein
MARNTRTRILAALVAIACYSTLSGAQAVTTTQDRVLAKLQEKLSRDPNNFGAVRDVGLKLFDLKRFSEARPLLDQAQRLRPRDGVSALYAGLAAEETKDLVAARAAYTKYLEVGKTRDTKNKIRARLIAIARDELKQAAAAAVANENALRAQVVDGKTVAVLPFRCNCADTGMRPLERGLAELVVTDLSVSKTLRVLERDRMQAIAEEIRLTGSGNVDATTATRAGKLIQAGSILNGSITIPAGNRDVTLASALVNTANGSIAANSPSANGLLAALFDAEKAFVLSAFNALGVTLLASERAQFEKRPTTNLNAFLAFSRGLMAADAGRLDEAQALFESARSMDPGFGAALQRAQQAAQGQAGAQVTSASVQQGMRNSAEGQVVSAAASGTAGAGNSVTLANVVADVNPTTANTAQNNTSGGGTSNTPSNQPQNTVSQATGGDQPALRTGQVTITIKRP